MNDEIAFFADKEAGGITGWWWITTDTGAWEGPKEDWESSHFPTMNQYLSSKRTAVQAGGNQGMYAKLLSKTFDAVYTFEPDCLNFSTLTANCDDSRIIKFQCALGDSISTIDVDRVSMQNVGMHRVVETDSGVIPQIPLDILCLQNVDLLMIDVEGYEEKVLRGSIETIARCKPLIFAERPSVSVSRLLSDMNYDYLCDSKMDGVFISR